MTNNVLILGGDGYLGWPTAMRLSANGYRVTVADNYMRRNSCNELDTEMLFTVPTLAERARVWHELTGYEIKVVICDLAMPANMRALFDGTVKYAWSISNLFAGLPDTVIHFAEQPSAPYSLINHDFADRTLINNLRVTNNLAWAVKDFSLDTHIIKLGTMGEYGTPNIDIEEGWIEIVHKGRTGRFLFPRQASSLYHTTKIMDTDLLWFGARIWGLRVTDLMQGPVYGLETEETSIDRRLNTIFNYDEVFGTVINRFIVQAVVGYPLTVYGQGGQTRGYLNLKDTLQCLEMAVKTPPLRGELRIFNQIMETFTVNELASLVKRVGDDEGLAVQIKSIINPRVEAEEHYYNPTYSGLIELGVKPNLLSEEVIRSMLKFVSNYKTSIRKDIIFRGVKW